MAFEDHNCMEHVTRAPKSERQTAEVREVLERLERIEHRLEDLQTLVDLQLEGTAQIKGELRDMGE
jgi:tetrahydromethanopterin S-methyltransferase subunit G